MSVAPEREAPRRRVAGGLIRAAAWVVPTWFVALAVVRAVAVLGGNELIDGRLYRAAALAWLQGGNPWRTEIEGLYFAAPPPSLLPILPFTILPEPLASVSLAVLGAVGSLWALRRLRKPLWWIAFPPLVDAIVNANPHVLLLPLLAGGGTWFAPVVKAYALPILVLRGQIAAIVVGGIALFVTAPVLPWGLFVDELPWVLDLFRAQVGGRFTASAIPVLLPFAVLSIAWVGRARAAWWVVPVFWPSTQYYYNSLAIPALTPVAAMVLCAQFDGVAAVALIVSAVELEVARRTLGWEFRPFQWRSVVEQPPVDLRRPLATFVP
jgi:hypothetical protein